LSTIDTEAFRLRLITERKRLVDAIDHLHRENPGSIEDETAEIPSDNHLGDLATVTFDRELEYGLEENAEHLLQEVDAALRRIDEGTYGTCRVCGEQIAPERLEAVPHTDLCIEDKRKQGRA
jgi:RNA polymerase-binding protein DksA